MSTLDKSSVHYSMGIFFIVGKKLFQTVESGQKLVSVETAIGVLSRPEPGWYETLDGSRVLRPKTRTGPYIVGSPRSGPSGVTDSVPPSCTEGLSNGPLGVV